MQTPAYLPGGRTNYRQYGSKSGSPIAMGLYSGSSFTAARSNSVTSLNRPWWEA
jgi:hypothetical protein